MSREILLPGSDGLNAVYRLGESRPFEIPTGQFNSRIAFSAAHVVSNPLANTDPLSNAQIDWEATLGYRRHLWSLGLSVAEAMDTAQRGMGLNWENAKELISRSL